MIRILFICHGNICRSPMAEFIMKDLVKKKGLEDFIEIASAATSTEEIGNPVHYGTKNKLREFGIDTKGKRAVQIRKEDYDKYDYLIAMDSRNIVNMKKVFGEDKSNKIVRLLDLTELKRDIADPWYTGNFDETYEDVSFGCKKLLEIILGNIDK